MLGVEHLAAQATLGVDQAVGVGERARDRRLHDDLVAGVEQTDRVVDVSRRGSGDDGDVAVAARAMTSSNEHGRAPTVRARSDARSDVAGGHRTDRPVEGLARSCMDGCHHAGSPEHHVGSSLHERRRLGPGEFGDDRSERVDLVGADGDVAEPERLAQPPEILHDLRRCSRRARNGDDSSTSGSTPIARAIESIAPARSSVTPLKNVRMFISMSLDAVARLLDDDRHLRGDRFGGHRGERLGAEDAGGERSVDADDVGLAGGDPQHSLAAAADQDRRARRLHRLRKPVVVGDRVVLAGEARTVRGPMRP